MDARFRVLTFNVFKLGSQVSPGKVISEVVRLEPDLIGFQEVFNTRLTIGIEARNAKRILQENLREHGFETVWARASGPSFLPGGKFHDGLMVAVRKDKWDFNPELDAFVEPLHKKIVERRILQCTLVREKENEGRAIAFCNTHLTVGHDEKKRLLRQEQVQKAQDLIGRIEKERKPVASILVGDFNAQRNSREIAMLLAHDSSIRFRDVWKDQNPNGPGMTLDLDNTIVKNRPPKRQPEASMRIDFIFLRPDPDEEGVDGAVRAVSSEVVLSEPDAETGQNLSDHYGVLAELRID